MQTRPFDIRPGQRTVAACVRWTMLLAATVLSVLSLGCRRDPYADAYFEMLNAEKRVLEDRLYDAEYNYEQALAELKAARGTTKEGRKPFAGKRTAESEQPLTEPAEEEPGQDSGVPTEVPELPKIELPPGVEEGKRRSSGPAAVRPAAAVKTEVPVVTTGKRRLNDEQLAAAIVSALDQRVESIYLNPRVSGGADFDGQPGDDGIRVLVEPRNRSGGFVPEPASLSIVLLDPAQSGQAARIARWDLAADDAAEFLQTDALDRGLLLRLPWQDGPPEHNRAHLFVRYLTADGRKIEADREIRIQATDRIAQSWTPRPTPVPEKEAEGAVPASWQPPTDADKPAVAQAAAEMPSSPRSNDDASKPTAAQTPAQTAAESPHARVLPAEADAGQTPRAAPAGRFWKPDR